MKESKPQGGKPVPAKVPGVGGDGIATSAQPKKLSVSVGASGESSSPDGSQKGYSEKIASTLSAGGVAADAKPKEKVQLLVDAPVAEGTKKEKVHILVDTPDDFEPKKLSVSVGASGESPSPDGSQKGYSEKSVSTSSAGEVVTDAQPKEKVQPLGAPPVIQKEVEVRKFEEEEVCASNDSDNSVDVVPNVVNAQVKEPAVPSKVKFHKVVSANIKKYLSEVLYGYNNSGSYSSCTSQKGILKNTNKNLFFEKADISGSYEHDSQNPLRNLDDTTTGRWGRAYTGKYIKSRVSWADSSNESDSVNDDRKAKLQDRMDRRKFKATGLRKIYVEDRGESPAL